MKKKYLILVNSADMMAKYHLALGSELEKSGNEVKFAFVDRQPLYRENLSVPDEKVHYFSDYFKANFENPKPVPEIYKDLNINKIYFSDYDRIHIYAGVKMYDSGYYDSLMKNLINFFHDIQKENNFNVCIYESVSNSFAYAAFEVLRRNDVQYCGYAGCRLKDRFELYTEEFGSLELFKKTFENTSLEEMPQEDLDYVDEYLSQYKNTGSIPSYHPKKTHLDWNYSILKRYFNFNKFRIVKGVLRYTIKEYKDLKYCYQSRNPVREIVNGIKMQILRQFRLRAGKKYFDTINIEEDFFLYPQHFKPESSTSVLARHYCNDVDNITKIAFNLPFGTKLYVKEHFVNFGRLPLSYYKALKNIPNVKLISPDENTKNLIQKAKGIITLTSTVGFEALMMSKPVFVFGNVFYHIHPNCRKLNGFENLDRELRNLEVVEDSEINRRFIAAYKNTSYPGNVYYSLSDNFEVDKFAKPFIAAMNVRFS